MILQKRLQRIASFVPPGSVAADIGADHALLPVYLVRHGICSKVIATDLNAGPLGAANSTVALFGLKKQVELRQGDGLEVIQPGEVDVIVIAGMGGVKISDILGRSQGVLQQAKRLILQPLGGAAQLRRWLLSRNWSLADEDLVQDEERFYEIIIAEHAPLTEGDNNPAPDPDLNECEGDKILLEIGPKLIEKRHPLLASFLEKQIRDMESVLIALRRAQTPAAKQRRQEWAAKIALYKQIDEKEESSGSTQ